MKGQKKRKPLYGTVGLFQTGLAYMHKETKIMTLHKNGPFVFFSYGLNSDQATVKL